MRSAARRTSITRHTWIRARRTGDGNWDVRGCVVAKEIRFQNDFDGDNRSFSIIRDRTTTPGDLGGEVDAGLVRLRMWGSPAVRRVVCFKFMALSSGVGSSPRSPGRRGAKTHSAGGLGDPRASCPGAGGRFRSLWRRINHTRHPAASATPAHTATPPERLTARGFLRENQSSKLILCLTPVRKFGIR